MQFSAVMTIIVSSTQAQNIQQRIGTKRDFSFLNLWV
jgi:hypothetical protein